ncbi:MAG TPA: hypothetical protein VLA98_07805 [Solirubrobacteraceae bacterium]|nr:hypothetical protein [Solirubrobacteraceae bacterium]HSD81794.1 hypothetical protein [Solirubrobacteraceae bacterium]
MEDDLEGIAAADARLGRPFPLPLAPLPLARWTSVRAAGEGAEVEWALDDSRDGAPGRLVLYAGRSPAPEHDVEWDGAARPVPLPSGAQAQARTAALPGAQPSLRPVRELRWREGDLHLRLTAQGPWPERTLVAIAASVDA